MSSVEERLTGGGSTTDSVSPVQSGGPAGGSRESHAGLAAHNEATTTDERKTGRDGAGVAAGGVLAAGVLAGGGGSVSPDQPRTAAGGESGATQPSRSSRRRSEPSPLHVYTVYIIV